jgi:hypothetical protein
MQMVVAGVLAVQYAADGRARPAIVAVTPFPGKVVTNQWAHARNCTPERIGGITLPADMSATLIAYASPGMTALDHSSVGRLIPAAKG